MGGMTFRKIPVEVEAEQWTKTNHGTVMRFLGGTGLELYGDETDTFVYLKEGLFVKTPNGPVCVSENDWVIKGVKGEFYPCKSDIFEATYEPTIPF